MTGETRHLGDDDDDAELLAFGTSADEALDDGLRDLVLDWAVVTSVRDTVRIVSRADSDHQVMLRTRTGSLQVPISAYTDCITKTRHAPM